MKVYNKKLYKSRENRVIAGVMGGLGEFFDIDPTLLRALFIVLAMFMAFLPGVVAYILMAIVIPDQPQVIHEKAKDPSSTDTSSQ